MKKILVLAAATALLGLSIVAHAAITIDTVRVGDPGNAADTASHSGNPAGQGSVSYAYNIGKYEVTAGQYCAFLNAVAKTDTYGVYKTGMTYPYGCQIVRSGLLGSYTYSVAADYADRPVTSVTFWDACRFANWLSNGQKSGAEDSTTTEDGAYTLNGYCGWSGGNIVRNANWKWAVTSEDEWYKAAYYDPAKPGGAGYWLYPTRSDTAPGADLTDASGNNANYYRDPYAWPIDNGKYTTVGGQFRNSASAYGTFDQAGNVSEWNEAIVYNGGYYTRRGFRGGSHGSGDRYFLDASELQSSGRFSTYPDRFDGVRDFSIGFRVSQAVPEPSSVVALVGGLAGLIGLRRRRAVTTLQHTGGKER